MTDHTIDTEMFYAGDWSTVPTYDRFGIVVERGQKGEGQDSPPSTVALTLDNRTRDYTPTNPEGVLFDASRRNIPVRTTIDGSVRATVEAATLEPDVELGGVDAWVTVGGSGILRRLQQGKTPLKSALHRAITAGALATPAAYWPMTEGTAATQFSSAVPGVGPIPIDGVVGLAELPGPAGTGAPIPNFAGGGGGSVVLPALGPSWGFEFVFYAAPLDDTIDGSVLLLYWNASSGTVGRDGWNVYASYGTGVGEGVMLFVQGNGAGTSDGFGVAATQLSPGAHHARVVASSGGGTVTVTLYVDGAVDPTFGTDSVVGGTLGTPDPMAVGRFAREPDNQAQDGNMNAGLAMLAFYDGTPPDNSFAATGYVGELTTYRAMRIGDEEGFTVTIVGDPDDAQGCGPQQLDTGLGIVREAVRTDAGMLLEPANGIGLAFRTGRSLINQDSVATFDFAAPGVAYMKPTFDDKPTANDVTAARPGGGTAQVVQTTGPMNINEPFDDPDGVGRVDIRHDVNPETDAVLVHHAGWRKRKGTNPEPRYQRIVLDLDDAPGLIADVNDLDVGDRITVENVPTDWAQEPVDLLVIGVRDELPSGGGHRRRKTSLVVEPASTHEVAIVGAQDGSVDLRGQRVATRLSTVNGAVAAGATTVVIDSAGIPWTTNAAHWNPALHGGGLFLLIAGEKVRVTNITGAGSAWTLTVARAQNGVSVAFPDNTPVRFWREAYVGL